MRMPKVVLLNEQLLIVKFCIPPEVSLPIETPCPKPNTQLETTISSEGKPVHLTEMLSSPSLMEQFWIRQLVAVRSMPSVLGEVDEVLTVIPCTVTLTFPPMSAK